MISRAGRTLAWNHENRLPSVSGGGLPTESYLYDDSGIRVKKTTGSTNSYYPFAHYEISGSTTIKYYFPSRPMGTRLRTSFGGQRVAMMNGSTFSYLHADHLGSTVLETNTSGNLSADQKYRAYGNQRDSGPRPVGTRTDHKFTGQKLHGTGLMYYQSRYYDPALGAFISPDTIVPDATNLFDFNRYMMVRGNPLKFTDPTGHYSNDEIMQHFGCQDWGCVESSFGEGGSHAGMWGWLYILQEARNGDTLRARGISTNSYAEMSGTFQMAANGRIELHGGSYISGAGSHQFSGAISEAAYAGFAGNFVEADVCARPYRYTNTALKFVTCRRVSR